ncbi:hypothetical protein GYA13_01390 [Candidatus Kuenenbacteria bacterium]|nr:hypothetical protein [Candidatus Kuenenbacteria bacterium]
MTICNRKWLVLLVGLIFFMADRFLKYFFLLQPTQPPTPLFHYSPNPNLVFSLPLPSAVRPVFYFFLLLIIIILASLFLRAWHHSQLLSSFALWFILLGAVSNTFDRFRYGAVIDYLDLGLLSILNLADIMISAGLGFLIYNLFWKRKIV